MRIAVCVSGAFVTKKVGGNLERNNVIMKMMFPSADFYYATWSQYKDDFQKIFPKYSCVYYDEPKMHYHPYLDIIPDNFISAYYPETIEWVKKGGSKRIEWTSHHTKQVLAHAWLSDRVKHDYDIIVRIRHDAFIHKDANFTSYLEDTVTHQRANCFGATRAERFDKLIEVDMSVPSLHNTWIVDPIIIHPANAIDTNKVNELHKDKKLHAAEFGWYQIISLPHGSNHRNHSGWVNADVRVLPQFLWKPGANK